MFDDLMSHSEVEFAMTIRGLLAFGAIVVAILTAAAVDFCLSATGVKGEASMVAGRTAFVIAAVLTMYAVSKVQLSQNGNSLPNTTATQTGEHQVTTQERKDFLDATALMLVASSECGAVIDYSRLMPILEGIGMSRADIDLPNDPTLVQDIRDAREVFKAYGNASCIAAMKSFGPDSKANILTAGKVP